MKRRQIAVGLSILAVAGGIGWRLATHQATSARLQDVSLVQHSEHSHAGPGALAGIRIRLSPSDADFGGIRIRLSPSDFHYQINGATHDVPQVSVSQ
jgi:hypothetical protein